MFNRMIGFLNHRLIREILLIAKIKSKEDPTNRVRQRRSKDLCLPKAVHVHPSFELLYYLAYPEEKIEFVSQVSRHIPRSLRYVFWCVHPIVQYLSVKCWVGSLGWVTRLSIPFIACLFFVTGSRPQIPRLCSQLSASCEGRKSRGYDSLRENVSDVVVPRGALS